MSATRTAIAGALLCLLVAAALVYTAGCGGGDGAVTMTISGAVYDNSNLNPVVGAIAQIAGRKSAPTNSSGAFTLSAVPVGQRQLTVYKSGYQTLRKDVEIVEGQTQLGSQFLEPALSPGLGHIAGHVQDVSSPVAGATVIAGGNVGRTKDDGSFAMYNLEPGTVRVTAQSGGKVGEENVVVRADDTSTAIVELTIAPPGAPVL